MYFLRFPNQEFFKVIHFLQNHSSRKRRGLFDSLPLNGCTWELHSGTQMSGLPWVKLTSHFILKRERVSGVLHFCKSIDSLAILYTYNTKYSVSKVFCIDKGWELVLPLPWCYCSYITKTKYHTDLLCIFYSSLSFLWLIRSLTLCLLYRATLSIFHCQCMTCRHGWEAPQSLSMTATMQDSLFSHSSNLPLNVNRSRR